MEKNMDRITVEPVENGFIVTVEIDGEETRYVYSSSRIVLREIKKLLKVDNDA